MAAIKHGGCFRVSIAFRLNVRLKADVLGVTGRPPDTGLNCLSAECSIESLSIPAAPAAQTAAVPPPAVA